MGWFGKTGDSQSEELVPLTNELIIEALKAKNYRWSLDSDGDICGNWSEERHAIWFLRQGKEKEVLLIRYQHSALFDAEQLSSLYEFCNDWNRQKFFPKSLVVKTESGRLRLIGELTVDLEYGVSRKQLANFISCGISTSLRMGESADEEIKGKTLAPAEFRGMTH